MATFFTKSLHFLGGVPKKQKMDSSGLAFAKTLKSCFVFFLVRTSSGNGNVFHQKLAFSWSGTTKQKKWILQASPSPRLSNLVLCFFWYVPPQEMATFSTKSLHFPGGYPKTTLDSSGLACAKTLKSLLFGFFGTSSATFPGLAILPAHYCIL